LADPLRNKPGRRTFHLARLEFRGARFVAMPVATTGSGDLLSMVRANAFLITDADQGNCPAGTVLDALPWREFDLR
jgi:molybdopterin biosynthesis enzyme